MGLDIYFPENIASTLLALSQANARAMILAKHHGADRQLINIAADVYQAALDDVAAAFGLAPTTVDGSGAVKVPAAWRVVREVDCYE